MPLTNRRSRKVRLLVAPELRYYRETLARTIHQLRPEVEVETVEAAALDDSILRLAPDMVICSKVTDVVRKTVPVWVELYPGHEEHSIVSIRGRVEERARLELSDLIFILDQVEVPPP